MSGMSGTTPTRPLCVAEMGLLGHVRTRPPCRIRPKMDSHTPIPSPPGPNSSLTPRSIPVYSLPVLSPPLRSTMASCGSRLCLVYWDAHAMKVSSPVMDDEELALCRSLKDKRFAPSACQGECSCWSENSGARAVQVFDMPLVCPPACHLSSSYLFI